MISDKQLWQCPHCGGILEKKEETLALKDQVAGLLGNVSCTYCAGGVPAAAVYDGQFDFADPDARIRAIAGDPEQIEFDPEIQRWRHDGEVVRLACDHDGGSRQAASEGRTSMLCDICGEVVESSDVTVVPPSVVGEPTRKGYVPSRMPPIWRAEHALFPFSFDTRWRTSVEERAGEEWALCPSCRREVQAFEEAPLAADDPIEEERHCVHFSTPVKIVKSPDGFAEFVDELLEKQGHGTHAVERATTMDVYVCEASVPIAGGPKPCAVACVHNGVVAAFGIQALIESQDIGIQTPPAQLRALLMEKGKLSDHLAPPGAQVKAEEPPPPILQRIAPPVEPEVRSGPGPLFVPVLLLLLALIAFGYLLIG